MRLCYKEWEAIDNICLKEKINRNRLISMIENAKDQKLGLSYSTRLFALLYYETAASTKKVKIENIIKDIS